MKKYIIVLSLLFSFYPIFSLGPFDLNKKKEALAQAPLYEKNGDYTNAVIAYSIGGTELDYYRACTRLFFRCLNSGGIDKYLQFINDANEYAKDMAKTGGVYWTVESAKILFYGLMVIDDTQLKIPE